MLNSFFMINNGSGRQMSEVDSECDHDYDGDYEYDHDYDYEHDGMGDRQ